MVYYIEATIIPLFLYLLQWPEFGLYNQILCPRDFSAVKNINGFDVRFSDILCIYIYIYIVYIAYIVYIVYIAYIVYIVYNILLCAVLHKIDCFCYRWIHSS